MTALLVEGVERIAVLRANALGDLLLALPAMEALRRAYPSAKITLLGREWHARFLRNRPGPVDEVVALPAISGVTADGSEAPGEIYDDLRARRFDVAVQMHGGGRNSNPFIRRLGAALTAGLCTPDAERLDRWVPYIHYQHETLRYLEVAGLLGAGTCDVEPRVAVIREDWAELNQTLGRLPRGLVAIHPGAGDPRRRWPPERFAEVADRLGRPVVVTGTEAERDVVEQTLAAMKRPARAVIDELSLGGLTALYAACDLLVSNDTGPRHLAAATGTPTVGVYWCGNLINWGPLSRRLHRPLISWTTRCPTCGRDGTSPGIEDCGHRSASWVGDVIVDDVLDQAQDLLR
ncbi:glycosyltransferase family 9 protein [Planotetraspora sp. A-T 1434]|uniref:glycosyltransferase family 9 protein n=1 Tax=Planotetraspora sp. A-T 1434 TaxID=2979219 RepID=UPI0021C02728|nr:glycosyltransferase family 9 protein [Planotetraspora sp. A-T 1434]MCT9933469.1 glycosyltransferase family 9 protein [Planotetraspora sp. A-T 1434]